MNKCFKNKVVIITGGAGGIGTSLTGLLLSQQAKVAVLDLNVDKMQTSENLLAVAADITSKQDIKDAINQILERFGQIDMLINNAGITHMCKFTDLSDELFTKVMAVNFTAAVNVTRLCLPELEKSKGRIVAISSVAGFAPLYGRSAYSASKHAMQGFFSSLAAEIKDKAISVTIICPSFVKSRPELTAQQSDKQLSPGATKNHTGGEQIPPDKAANQILEAACRRKPYLYLGRVSKLTHWIFNLFPKLYYRLMINDAKKEFETN